MAPERLGYSPAMTFDRPCRSCGYNLRGLHFGSACPECHHAVGDDRTLDEPIARQDPAVLRMLHRSVVLAHFSWLTIVALTFFLLLRGNDPTLLMIMMAAGAGLNLAAWLLTIPIDHRDARMHGYGAQAPMRWPLRAALAAWVLAAFSALAHVQAPIGQTGDALRTAMMLVCAGATITAAAGTILLCIHLRRLCDWSRDDAAASALNLAAWLLAGIVPVTAIMLVRPLITTQSATATLLLIALPVLNFLVVLGALAMSWGLMLLCGALRLSIRHGHEYRELDQRRLERSRRFEAEIAERSGRAGVP